jgi:thiamine-phosphate pyrophosphorylase
LVHLFGTKLEGLTMKTPKEIALEVALAHAYMLAGDAIPYMLAVHPGDLSLSDHSAGVLQGCRMLGFLEHDAQCIAKAWCAQTQRTGHFSINDWPCQPEDFNVPLSLQEQSFLRCPNALGLYAVLPDAKWIERMAHAGVPTLQLRVKSNSLQAIRQEVRAAVHAVRGTDSLLFINDHWQIAIDEAAYGVHLGQEDMDDVSLESIRTAGLRLGLSTHGYAEMLRADALGPSYLALGAIFPTTLKKMRTPPQGIGRLYAYARLMRHRSLVAIGGIDESRIKVVMSCGVGSIAMARAITSTNQPDAYVNMLINRIRAFQI